MALPKKISRDLAGAPESVKRVVGGLEDLMGETMPVTHGQPPEDATILTTGDSQDGAQVWLCRVGEMNVIYWDWVPPPSGGDGDDGRVFDIPPPDWSGGPT